MMKNLKTLTSLFIILLMVSTACSAQKFSFNVINLKEARGIRHYSTLYALPKTVIRVNLKVIKTSYKKGPYHNYANSYLDLTNVIEEDKELWKITDIKFETYAIADTNHIYLIETNDELNKIELKLTESGLLEAIYPQEYTNCPIKKDISEYKSIPLSESVLLKSHKLTEKEELNFDDVPLPKSVLAKRTTSEQATELSAKILALREDRAAILVGDGYTQAMPEGEALKIMVEKIDLIQNLYLTMFKGKSKKESFQYTFDYIPEEPRKITQTILFRFSEEHGIVENTDMSGEPMIIEIESYENIKKFEQFKKNQQYLKRVAKYAAQNLML